MIHSEPYRPDPRQCCARCAFGRGQHADYCQSRDRRTVSSFEGSSRRPDREESPEPLPIAQFIAVDSTYKGEAFNA